MSASLTNTLVIAIGGALGSVARYWGAVWMAPYSQSLPWGTILINILGSFAITFFGTLTIMSGRIPLPDSWRLFFMVGICGGFTTFSSFSLQTFELLHMNKPGPALANIAVSVLLCLAASAVGFYAAASINGGTQQAAQIEMQDEA